MEPDMREPLDDPALVQPPAPLATASRNYPDYLLFLSAVDGAATFYCQHDDRPEGVRANNRKWTCAVALTNREIWGERVQLTVATDMAPVAQEEGEKEGSGEQSPGAPAPRHWYYDELLKSALQKAVRRRLQWTAVRVAFQLMRQDMNKFLRRMPVIIMEDAIPHPRMLTLIWLMVAHSKGWVLTRRQVIDSLQIVFEVASCPYHDIIPKCNTTPHHTTNPLSLKAKSRMDQMEKNMIAALLIRASYGGMKGDVQFLHEFAGVWRERLRLHSPEWTQVVNMCYTSKFRGNEMQIYYYKDEASEEGSEDTTYTEEGIGAPKDSGVWELQAKDKIKEAVDFHCFPQIIQRLLEEDELKSLTEAELRSAIWFHRSGVYEKKLICSRDQWAAPMSGSSETSEEPTLNTKPKQKHEATLQVWRKVEPFLDALVADPYYWKARLPPQQRPGSKQQPAKRLRVAVGASASSSSLEQPTLKELFAKRATNSQPSSPSSPGKTNKKKKGLKQSSIAFFIQKK